MKTFWAYFEEQVGDEWVNFIDSDERVENADIADITTDPSIAAGPRHRTAKREERAQRSSRLTSGCSIVAGPLYKTAKREERAQRSSRLSSFSSLIGKGKKIITEAREERMQTSSRLSLITWGKDKRKGLCTGTEAREEEHARNSLAAMMWGNKTRTRAREALEQTQSTLHKSRFK